MPLEKFIIKFSTHYIFLSYILYNTKHLLDLYNKLLLFGDNIKISISEKTVTIWLVYVTAALTFLSILGQISKFYLGHPRLFGFVYVFNVGSEGNIPTIFYTIVILFTSCITSFIFVRNKKNNEPRSIYWLLISLIFMYLAVDEGWIIHERLILSLNYFFNDITSINYFLIIGGLFIGIIILIFLGFSLSLDISLKKWLYLALALYIIGAFALELVSKWYISNYGGGFVLEMISTVEEVLEMLGIILFIKTFLKFLKLQSGKIDLKIEIT